jgi:thymidylate kinase
MNRNGSLICFTGIDGSGKTTQARLLVDWLTSRGIQSVYTWSRGEVLAIRRLFLRAGRRALGTSVREIARDQSAYRDYQTRKSKLMGNEVVRTLWSATTYAEHFVQINRDIRRSIRDGYWVVCDRYQWDTLIDLAVLNNRSSEWLVGGFNRFMWKLIPQPAVTFLIDLPAEEAMRRKSDIPSLDYVQKRRDHYRYLAKSEPLKVIDGCRDTAAIHSEIISTLIRSMEGQGEVWPG